MLNWIFAHWWQVLLVIVIFIIVLNAVLRAEASKCPKCGKKSAMIEISRIETDSVRTTVDVNREKNIKNSSGKTIRTETYKEAVPATKYYYDCIDECKYCGYRREVQRSEVERD